MEMLHRIHHGASPHFYIRSVPSLFCRLSATFAQSHENALSHSSRICQCGVCCVLEQRSDSIPNGQAQDRRRCETRLARTSSHLLLAFVTPPLCSIWRAGSLYPVPCMLNAELLGTFVVGDSCMYELHGQVGQLGLRNWNTG